MVRLDDDQYAQLEAAAVAQGVTVSAYMRSVIGQSAAGVAVPELAPTQSKEAAQSRDTAPQGADSANVEKLAGVYDKGKARRGQIAAHALEAYSQSGFNNVSLRDIAARCGLSHQALMHYFPTKEALIRAALELRDQRLVQHFATGVDVQELVRMAADNESRPGHVAMFNIAAAEASTQGHIAHQYYVEFYAELVAAISKSQAVVEAAESVSDLDRHELARLVLAMMDGLQLQWSYRQDDFSVSKLLHDGVSALGINSVY